MIGKILVGGGVLWVSLAVAADPPKKAAVGPKTDPHTSAAIPSTAPATAKGADRPAAPEAGHGDESANQAKPEPKAEGKSKATGAKREAAAATAEPAARVNTPDEALEQLRDGNRRWAAHTPNNPRVDDARLKAQSEGQTPFAAVLTCADSRVPVERVFDQGVGDLFTIRVAGNIAGDHQTGSLEYGVEHLKIPLLVVMGHTKCGAVAAAVSRAQTEGSIPTLLREIEPAVRRAQNQNPSAEAAQLVPSATRENVWQTVTTLLRTSSTCREAVASGKLRIVGAVYNVGEGTVEWLGEHPWQSELLAAFTPAESGERREAAAEH